MDEQLTIEKIKELLPHRYPFLMLDKISAVQPGKSLTAIKNVSINEPIFQGHFPQLAIFPGVLIVEAMAQASGVLAYLMANQQKIAEEKLYFLAKIDNAKFKKPVVPGDQMQLQIEFDQQRNNFAIFKTNGKAMVEGSLVCEVELTLAEKRT